MVSYWCRVSEVFFVVFMLSLCCSFVVFCCCNYHGYHRSRRFHAVFYHHVVFMLFCSIKSIPCGHDVSMMSAWCQHDDIMMSISCLLRAHHWPHQAPTHPASISVTFDWYLSWINETLRAHWTAIRYLETLFIMSQNLDTLTHTSRHCWDIVGSIKTLLGQFLWRISFRIFFWKCSYSYFCFYPLLFTHCFFSKNLSNS